jgi:hypothetical protein
MRCQINLKKLKKNRKKLKKKPKVNKLLKKLVILMKTASINGNMKMKKQKLMNNSCKIRLLYVNCPQIFFQKSSMNIHYIIKDLILKPIILYGIVTQEKIVL